MFGSSSCLDSVLPRVSVQDSGFIPFGSTRSKSQTRSTLTHDSVKL
ncbi:hypothetical protein HanPSC8_Chr14g0626771 [Helianthus annuus]|nr:hypothetical protein HanPSC8_Chr14g0626771 [Helianthus annuus]